MLTSPNGDGVKIRQTEFFEGDVNVSRVEYLPQRIHSGERSDPKEHPDHARKCNALFKWLRFSDHRG